jgi:hypothetical protein
MIIEADNESFDGHATGPYQAAQGSLGYFSMIGNRERRHMALLDQDHVASTLLHHLPTVSRKDTDYIASTELGQSRH